MCLITYTPDKALLNLDQLQIAMSQNPHGFGVVYADNGTLQICRQMKGWDYFVEVLKLVPEKTPVAIHFRWATQGDKVVENTHPFRITAKAAGHAMDLCMMHNGTIPGTVIGHGWKAEEREWSDTRKYVVHHLRPFLQKYPDAVFDPVFVAMIERDIGYNSKLLFMAGDGRISIVNKKAGDVGKEHPDMWFSNTYSFNENHRSKKNTTTTTNSSAASSGTGDSNKRSVVCNIYDGDKNTSSSSNHYGIEIPEDAYIEPKAEMPEYLKNMLAYNEQLLRRKPLGNHIETVGFGWVHDGKTITHRLPVALAHKRWVKKREEEKEQELVSAVKESQNTTVVSQAIVNAANLINSLNEQFDSMDFRKMTPPEMYQWVTDYPKCAAKWMSKNGFFATENQIIEALENNTNDFIDAASEFIYKKSRNEDHIPPVDDYKKYNFKVA